MSKHQYTRQQIERVKREITIESDQKTNNQHEQNSTKIQKNSRVTPAREKNHLLHNLKE